MSEYKPSLPFAIAFMLLTPTYTTISGVEKKTFTASGEIIYGSFKTYGGTEHAVNGIYSIEDTANIETWFRPDIKSDCRIKRVEDGAVYEIINEPEDINFRHQFMKFKVKRVKGGA